MPDPRTTQADSLHVELVAIGLGLGAGGLALSRWRGGRGPSGSGLIAFGVVVASMVVLVIADQLAITAVAVLVVGGSATGALCRWVPNARVWSPDAYLAATTSAAVLYAVLPDTEGAVVLGAALTPMLIGAIAAPAWWTGTGAGAGAAALAVGIVAVASASDGGRDGVLIVALAAAVACSALTIAVGRLLIGRAPITSERGRPSP